MQHLRRLGRAGSKKDEGRRRITVGSDTCFILLPHRVLGSGATQAVTVQQQHSEETVNKGNEGDDWKSVRQSRRHTHTLSLSLFLSFSLSLSHHHGFPPHHSAGLHADAVVVVLARASVWITCASGRGVMRGAAACCPAVSLCARTCGSSWAEENSHGVRVLLYTEQKKRRKKNKNYKENDKKPDMAGTHKPASEWSKRKDARADWKVVWCVLVMLCSLARLQGKANNAPQPSVTCVR